MCGIAGLLRIDGSRPDGRQLASMLGSLTHRGPDDEGSWADGPIALGMRRLSILDPTPRGHQPMTSPDGRYTIVHNGEVYNFLELAAELRAAGRSFVTETDTEVILAAYAEWGVAGLERLNGIWAFAIWDSVKRTLLLSRDRLGVKPLYLVEVGGGIAFASEIKALLTLPDVSRDPAPEAVAAYLDSGALDRGTTTFFRQVARFPAAHALEIRSEGRRWTRYWSPSTFSTDASPRPDRGDDDLVDAVRCVLVDSVRLQLRTDVPIGSCLSGGLDSSSIVSIASRLRDEAGADKQRQGNAHLAFFAQFRDPGIDERPFVDAVVAATGVELRTTTPASERFLESLDGVLAAQDEPFASLSIVAQYEVMRLAHASGVKVLLDGQGADELFGGYLHHPAIRMAGAIRSASAAGLMAAAGQVVGSGTGGIATLGRAVIGSRSLPLSLGRTRLPRAWRGPRIANAAPPPALAPGPRSTPLGVALWREIADENLPGLLRYEDRNSMAFGIEARVPFLDHRVVELALTLPDRLRVRSRADRKIALVRAMHGIVPDAVLGRTDKVAFQPPQARWLRETTVHWRAETRDPRAEAEGFLAPGSIVAALTAFERGRGSATVLWRVLNLELWLRRSAGVRGS